MSYISTQGDVVWQCRQKFDSSFIFGGLLSKSKGVIFRVSPSSDYTSEQYYIENTNILVTHFKAKDGEFRLIDFAPRFLNFERHHKPLSLIERLSLSLVPLIKVKCMPVGDYGNIKAENHLEVTP